MTENNEVGKVKFFNHKKGYGFIRIINPESKYVGTDQFVHFTEVKCKSEFKKLIPGEIVSLSIGPGNGNHKTTSKNVCGLYDTELFIDSEKYIYKVRKKENYYGVEDQDSNNDDNNDDNVD